MTVVVTYAFELVQNFALATGPVVRNVDVVGLANGGFAAVGQIDNTLSAFEIYNGALTLTGSQTGPVRQAPAIAQLTNGNIAIVSRSGASQSFLDIVDQAGNTVVSREIDLTLNLAADIDIAALPGNTFVVTTVPSSGSAAGAVRIFNNVGTELAAFSFGDDVTRARVIGLDDGGFVVAWEEFHLLAGLANIWTAVYNANGGVRRVAQLADSSDTGGMSQIALTATDGGFAIVYEDDTVSANTDIALRRFEADGDFIEYGTLTGPATIDNTPSIARMPGGMLAISAGYSNVGPADSETFLGLFDPATGTFLAQRITTIGEPLTDDTDFPEIASHGLGRVAFFHTNTTDNDVDGEVVEVVRTSTGDATGEFFDPSSYRDIQNGGGGSDFLDGGDANDTLNGEAGGDNLFGGPGNDILNGGSEADTALYTGTAAVAVNLSLTSAQNTGGAGVDTLTGIENLIGGNGDDIFSGNALANRLDGGVGNDQLAGGGDNDTLVGGAGSDTAVYAEKTQAVAVFLNGNTDAVVTVGGAAEDTVRDIENVSGGSGKDSLVGDGQANVFNGNGGNDFLFGASFAAGGAFAPGSGADTLNGGAGDDGLWGGDGVDTMNGGANNDGMAGGAGNDAMNGGDGADFLFGGDFSATNGSRLSGSGDDTLNGGAGNDALYGFDGIDTINGDAGNDYVEAGEDNDVVNGGADSDTLLGQTGNDTITGGSGFDYLYGGAGADIFSFRKGDSYDTAWDFSVAQGDKLRLDPALGITTFAQFQARLTGFTFEGVAYSRINFASLGSNDEITIGGVAKTAWTAAMVEFA